MTPEQKLDAIRALCGEWDERTETHYELIRQVRVVLDAPSSPVPATPDRDALLALLADLYPGWHDDPQEHRENADRILALVRPACIDRDTLRDVLRGWTPVAMHPFLSGMADAIIAAIRPTPHRRLGRGRGPRGPAGAGDPPMTGVHHITDECSCPIGVDHSAEEMEQRYPGLADRMREAGLE